MGVTGSKAEAQEESPGNQEDIRNTEFQHHLGEDGAEITASLTRIGIETAGLALGWLPEAARERIRHTAGNTLRGLALGPYILGGVLEVAAREVETYNEMEDLGVRKQTDDTSVESGEGTSSDSGATG